MIEAEENQRRIEKIKRRSFRITERLKDGAAYSLLASLVLSFGIAAYGLVKGSDNPYLTSPDKREHREVQDELRKYSYQIDFLEELAEKEPKLVNSKMIREYEKRLILQIEKLEGSDGFVSYNNWNRENFDPYIQCAGGTLASGIALACICSAGAFAEDLRRKRKVSKLEQQIGGGGNGN